MLAFSRKKLSGSYCALTGWRRAMLVLYAAVAANSAAGSSACPVKFVYEVDKLAELNIGR